MLQVSKNYIVFKFVGQYKDIHGKRSVGSYEISQSDEEQSFVGYSDESTSSGSDEFGVSGDWGQNVDGSDDEESDSEFCIDRFDKCN